MSGKKIWQGVILLFLGVVTFGYLSNIPDVFVQFQNITYWNIFILLLLRGMFLLVNGLLLKDFSSRFSVVLKPIEWIGLSFVTALGNYIAPFSGGLIARAGYLKSRHSLSITNFAVLLSSNYLVNFFGVAIAGLAGCFSVMGSSTKLPWQLPVLFFSVAGGVLALVVLPLPVISSNNLGLRKINEALEGWKLIRNDWSLILRLLGYTFCNILLNSLSFYVAFRSIGVDIPYFRALLISLIAVFSLLINITPANLGVQEAVVGLASVVLSQSTSEGLIVALIIRASTMLLVFSLGPIFAYTLSRDFNRYGDKNNKTKSKKTLKQ